jgi:hypothetical protein
VHGAVAARARHQRDTRHSRDHLGWERHHIERDLSTRNRHPPRVTPRPVCVAHDLIVWSVLWPHTTCDSSEYCKCDSSGILLYCNVGLAPAESINSNRTQRPCGGQNEIQTEKVKNEEADEGKRRADQHHARKFTRITKQFKLNVTRH